MIEPKKHRNLRQHRQTSENGVEAVLALQLLHFERHPLTILAVFLLQGLDLWLQFLHLPGGANLAHERLVQQRTQREDQEHHRQRAGEEVGWS